MSQSIHAVSVDPSVILNTLIRPHHYQEAALLLKMEGKEPLNLLHKNFKDVALGYIATIRTTFKGVESYRETGDFHEHQLALAQLLLTVNKMAAHLQIQYPNILDIQSKVNTLTNPKNYPISAGQAESLFFVSLMLMLKRLMDSASNHAFYTGMADQTIGELVGYLVVLMQLEGYDPDQLVGELIASELTRFDLTEDAAQDSQMNLMLKGISSRVLVTQVGSLTCYVHICSEQSTDYDSQQVIYPNTILKADRYKRPQFFHA